MNCCFLILILLLCNGSCGERGSSCGRCSDCDNNRDRRGDGGCRCQPSQPQPRVYPPYAEPRTCGCEES